MILLCNTQRCTDFPEFLCMYFLGYALLNVFFLFLNFPLFSAQSTCYAQDEKTAQ
jgi:hypothetical protein